MATMTPPPSPDVAAQMGGPSSPGGSMFRSMAGGAGGAAPAPAGGMGDVEKANPQGAFINYANVLKKLVEQMSRVFPKFAPTGGQIVRLLEVGMKEVLSAGPSGDAGGSPQPEMEGEPSLSFPG